MSIPQMENQLSMICRKQTIIVRINPFVNLFNKEKANGKVNLSINKMKTWFSQGRLRSFSGSDLGNTTVPCTSLAESLDTFGHQFLRQQSRVLK